MNRTGTVIAAAALFCGLLAGGRGKALAGHPLGTEDAETQGEGNVEVEFNVERLHGNDGTRTTSPGNFITVGIAPKLDLAVGYACDFTRESDGTSSRRMGPVDATIKRVFTGGEKRYPALGIKAGVSFPTAEGEQAALLATAIGEGSFGPTTVFANVGAIVGTNLAGNAEKSTSIRASIAGSREFREEWYLLAELLWEKRVTPSAASSGEWLIGGKKEISEALSVNGGIRWGIAGDSPHVTYLLGLTYGYRGNPPVPAATPVRGAR